MKYVIEKCPNLSGTIYLALRVVVTVVWLRPRCAQFIGEFEARKKLKNNLELDLLHFSRLPIADITYLLPSD